MASTRKVVIAGAGIAGLTAALALARQGFRPTVMEQTLPLEETGAGIQLSPNATRVLLALGLGDRLRPHVVAPQEVRVMLHWYRQPIARIPLGDQARDRYGAPYWVIHRGDLQHALRAAAQENPDIALKLGLKAEDFTTYSSGVTVAARRGSEMLEERCNALIGADGLWSALRRRLHGAEAPRFARRIAWRALVPADAAPEEYRAPIVYLWLSHDMHLVHYPVRGGREINVVAIAREQTSERGWSNPRSRDDLLSHFPRWVWPRAVRDLIEIPDRWLTWALFDRAPLRRWGKGAVTLIGDAAHPMVPFLAQGAAMAIEDAAVLADRYGRERDAPERAFRAYEATRTARTARVQRAAFRNGRIYHASGIEAFARNAVLRLAKERWLLQRYDWLYSWKADEAPATATGGS